MYLRHVDDTYQDLDPAPIYTYGGTRSSDLSLDLYRHDWTGVQLGHGMLLHHRLRLHPYRLLLERSQSRPLYHVWFSGST